MKRLGYEFGTVLVTFVRISYFALQICINSTWDTFLVSTKKLTKFIHISAIIPSYLKISNKCTSFYDKCMFSEDGLKCRLKRHKQFFEENMDLLLVCCFASLVLYIFLKQSRMNVWYFVVNCALFWFWCYARETSLDWSKTWVDNNIRFSTSILLLKNNNYRTVHWHIRSQSDYEQVINKLRPNSCVLFLAETLYTFSKSRLSKYKSGVISPEQLKVWNFALWWKKIIKLKIK